MSYSAMAWARRQVTGSPTLKAVLLAVANYADEDGTAWPSQVRLSSDTELSERSIIRALQELQERGFLDIERRSSPSGRKTNILALKLTQPDSVSPRPKVTESQVPKVTGCPKSPDRLSPKPLENRSVVTVATATVKNLPPDYDQILFDEGKKIAAGSMIAKLKKVCGGDPVKALEIVRIAAGRSDPLAYLSAAIRDEEKRHDRGQRHFDAIDEAARRASEYFDRLGVPRYGNG